MKHAPPWLLASLSVFVLAIGVLVASSLFRATPEAYAPTVPSLTQVRAGVMNGEYTVDARDPDRWVYFDFSRNAVVDDPGPREWDLAFQRFHVIVNGGAGFAGDGGARDLEAVGDDGVLSLHLPENGYMGTEGTLESRPRHPALERWYDYGFFTHLLTPRQTVYAIRTADGRYAALRFVAYYCPGAQPGCVTFRYVYRGDGERVLQGTVLFGDDSAHVLLEQPAGPLP